MTLRGNLKSDKKKQAETDAAAFIVRPNHRLYGLSKEYEHIAMETLLAVWSYASLNRIKDLGTYLRVKEPEFSGLRRF